MTTIVYNHKEQIIAYDSRECGDGVIMSDSVNKKQERDGVIFFGAGCTDEIEEMIECYTSKNEPKKENNATALIVEDKEVYQIGCDKGELWKQKREFSTAIGSGYRFALTAIDLGCSAKKAVKMAKKRDAGTGGKIKTYKIGG